MKEEMKTPARRRRGRPSKANTLDQALLLQLTLKAFAENGFEGTSLKTISDQLNIDDSLIYYHYKNKQNLWKQAMWQVITEYERQAKETVRLCKDQNTIDLGKSLTRHLVYFMAEHIEVYKIMNHELTQRSERSEWIIDNMLKPLGDRLTPIFQAYKRAGYEVNIPINNYIALIFGILSQFFFMDTMSKRLYGVDVYQKEEVDRHADIAVGIIFSSIFRKIRS